jgi:hypothetical protein
VATPQTNEQRLDAAEKILLAVLKDIRNNLSKYNATDYRALEEAWIQLNGITLTQKSGIVHIPDSFWKPYDDHKAEQAKA